MHDVIFETSLLIISIMPRLSVDIGSRETENAPLLSQKAIVISEKCDKLGDVYECESKLKSVGLPIFMDFLLASPFFFCHPKLSLWPNFLPPWPG